MKLIYLISQTYRTTLLLDKKKTNIMLHFNQNFSKRTNKNILSLCFRVGNLPL